MTGLPLSAVAAADAVGSARVTVVLPCSGAGSRLGLPFAKELLPLGPGRTPLSETLALLEPHTARIRVLVVAGPDREATLRAVHAWAAGRVSVAVIAQLELSEASGAVLSALAWLDGPALVLLPDQVLTAPTPVDPIAAALTVLETTPFCFLGTRTDDQARISADGALHVDDAGQVTAYAEHPPLDQAAGYNAVWFGFGFTPAAISAVEIIHAALTRRSAAPRLDGTPLHGCPMVETGPFTDAGTWPNVQTLWRDHLSESPTGREGER